MARVLAISSHVARGAIGLSAAAPVLQALGHEVIALPTILLSNHPGHPHFAGERVAPDLLLRMLGALDANGWLAEVDALLTGYLPSAGHVAVAVDAVALLRRRNPGLVFLCDAVLGDDPKGLYIETAAAEALRDRLAPLADIRKMNRFELGWLTGSEVRNANDVATLAIKAGWHELIATSVPAVDAAEIASVLCVADAPAQALSVRRLDAVPHGTGDVMAALLLGYRLHPGGTPDGAFAGAVEAVARIIEASVGHDELQLVAALAGLSPRAHRPP